MPGMDFCELYALEDNAEADFKAEVETKIEEASELMYQNQVQVTRVNGLSGDQDRGSII